MGVFGWCGADLPRRSSQFHRHVSKGRQKRERLRQVQDYAPHRCHYPRSQFQEAFPQCPCLRPSAVGARGRQAQLLHQHVGRGGQQHAELVGPKPGPPATGLCRWGGKPTATGAIDLKSVQLLDPVLDFATLAIDLFIDPLRTLPHVGDHDDDRRYPQRPLIGVGALILNRDRILMAQRGKQPLKGAWSLPGGAVEAGEALDAAVRREVREETGLEVKPVEVFEIFERIMRDSRRATEYHYVLIDYICRVTGGELRAATMPAVWNRYASAT